MMHAAGSTSISVSVSKKRCWTLSFKDVKKNDVEEADLLSAFRKRYTSVRRLSFRPPLPPGTFDNPTHLLPDRESLDTHTTTSTEGRSLCVEVQFTGPQPIEGPACLMCDLLDGSFVGAHPVQLDRGRKRKTRAVVAGVAAPLASYGAPLPGCGSADGSLDTQELFTTDAARGGAADCNASSVSSSASFVLGTDGGSACGPSGFDSRLAHNLGDGAPAPTTATPAMATMPTTKKIKREAEDDCGSTSSGDAPTDLGPAPFYLSASSSTTSISSSGSSDFDELFDDLQREDESSSANEDMFSSALAAWGLSLESPSGIAVAVGSEDGDDSPPPPSRSTCSSAVTPASEEGLPTCDDPVRCAAAAMTTATTSTDTTAIRGSPVPRCDLAAGRSCRDGGGKSILQEDIASLFDHPGMDDGAVEAGVPVAAVSTSAATAAAAAAAGGAHVSADGLWGAAPMKADGLLLPPEARRLCSSSWVPLPVHAGTVVADEGNGGIDVSCVEDRGEQQQPPATAAGRPQQARSPSERWSEERQAATVPASPVDATGDGKRPPTPRGEGISVVWREEECDFHGHGCTAPPCTTAEPVPSPTSSPLVSSSSPPTLPPVPCHCGNVARPCQLELRGLGSVVAQGHDLEDLIVSARFSVHPEVTAESVAGLVGIDAADPASDDRAIAAVPYPSIWQVWPEVGKMAHILAVEVDLQVELRSKSGDIIHTAPVLKVTYRRPGTRTLVATA